MRLLQAPHNIVPDHNSGNYTYLFLAGGITGCPPWQSEVAKALSDMDNLCLFDPRRPDWNDNADDAEIFAQVEWEYRHLILANAILFWFPMQTMCPIALFELGAYSKGMKKLFIGCHPGYERLIDVRHQIKLAREGIEPEIHLSLTPLLEEVKEWVCGRH